MQSNDAHYYVDMYFTKIGSKIKMVRIFFQVSFQYSYLMNFLQKHSYFRTQMSFKPTFLLLFPLVCFVCLVHRRCKNLTNFKLEEVSKQVPGINLLPFYFLMYEFHKGQG